MLTQCIVHFFRRQACKEFDGKSVASPKLPTLKDLMNRRRNPKAYSFFCYFFLRKVVGHAHFKCSYESTKSIQETVTASDEAYALCVLEGIWDLQEDTSVGTGTVVVCEDRALNGVSEKDKMATSAPTTTGTVPPGPQAGTSEQGNQNEVPMASNNGTTPVADNEDSHTDSGKNENETTSVTMCKNRYTALPGQLKELPHGGWTEQGVQRFNILQREIALERKNLVLVAKFDEYFASTIVELSGGRVGKIRGRKRKQAAMNNIESVPQVAVTQEVLWGK